MHSASCPTCDALHGLLVEAEPQVVRRGVEARARGPGWGVLVADPDELGAETDEEASALAEARERGYFVGVMSIDSLLRFVPEKGHDPAALAGIRRQLCLDPPEGQIHVLAALDGCVATVTARADAEILAAREREEARLQRIVELLALAEPEVLRHAGEQARRPRTVFLVAAADNPALARLRGVSAADLEAARAAGVYVALHEAADAIAALPLEDLEAEDALRATRRLTQGIPEGSVRAIAVHDGHMTVVTRPAEPGCMSIS